MATETKSISASQRAQNFAAATRQNFHMLPAQTTTELGTTMQFNFPKSRLLSKTFVKVEAVYNTDNLDDLMTFIQSDFSAYKIIRRISLSLNNGFDPFVISGRDLAVMNCIRNNAGVVFNSNCPTDFESKYTISQNGLIEVTTDNTKVKVTFLIELENTLNQRDTSGLILLQNESTQVTLSLDIENAPKKIHSLITGVESVKVTPMLQTYTIPNYAEAFPDLSILKLVKSRTETLPNSGEHILKLDVGTIYRKIVFYVTDSNGNPTDDLFSSNIELVYNTADTPISIDPMMLKLKNTSDFGVKLPKGMFVFDFSGYAGFSNYGGSRDFVDTERLTEFWVRFTTKAGGQITTVQENLSRLR